MRKKHLPPEPGSSRATRRFPLELAGVAFKQKRYTAAVRHLRRALRLDPADSYGNEFLGTVYFLQGNTEAALKYWNRVGKPQIMEVRSQPTPQVNAALLDRAMTFAPASVLRVLDLLTTEVRIRGLEIFPRYQFDLQARSDGKFDILFRNRERDGWGQGSSRNYSCCFEACPFRALLLSSTTCEARRSTLLPCTAGMRRRDERKRNCQVRSRGIQNSATD